MISQQRVASTWDSLETSLYQFSVEKLGVESDIGRLLVGVIVSGGKENDVEYLESDVFLYHCYLVKLDSDYVLEIFNRMRHAVKYGMI